MSVQKITRFIFILALIIAIASPVSFAAETDAASGAAGSRTVLTVGSTAFNETEILLLLMGDSGGNDMMAAMMMGQSTLEDRRQLVSNISDAVLFAEAAKDKKLDQEQDTAFQIKWQTIQVLVQAYFNRASANWDFSEAGARKYYNSRRGEFFQEEAVKASHILTENESDALMAMLEAASSDFAAVAKKYSCDPNTVQDGGNLGWVEKGMMTGSVDKAIMNGRPGQTVGPVRSEFGWHVIKIEDRRPGRQLSFEEASEAILQSVHSAYIEQEVKKLKEKYPVKINDDALGALGGIPALSTPKPAK